MVDPQPARPVIDARRVVTAAALASLLVAGVVLFAWAIGNEPLKTIHPDWPTMKANTALGIAALGGSLALAVRGRATASAAAAGLAVVIGGLTLLQYATGADLGIDELLFEDHGSTAGTTAPGRMAVMTASAFVLLGLALLSWRMPGSGAVRHVATGFSAFFALFNVAFYFLGAIPPIEGTRMAFHTAALLLVLCVGIALGREGRLPRTILAADGTGRDVRRLLVAVVALPLLFGWFARKLYEAGFLDVAQRGSFALVANLCILLAAVLVAALRLRREADQRKHAEAVEREAKEALRQSVRRTEDAERVTGRGSWEWDVTTDRAIWSTGMYRLFGLDPATFVNSNENFLALVHPEDQARMGQAIADALERPGPFLQEYRLTRPDGRLIHVRGEGDVLVADGKAKVLYGFVQDVTATREMAAARRRAEERFRRVFESSPVPITLTKDDGTFLDVNDAYCRLVARPREEILGGSLTANDVWEDPEERTRLLAHLRSGGLVKETEAALRRPDGSLRTVLATLEYVDIGGGTTVLTLLQDITERKKAQLERETRISTEAELERLRRTDEFRGQFINSTAHELKTPMTPLLLSLGSLHHTVGADPAAARQLAVAQRAADRLNRVIADMVSAADLQARAIALDKQRLDLTRQLKAAVAGHTEAAQRANLALEEPPANGLAVLADEHRLQLVLGHLLGNAIKFTPAGGTIALSSRRDGGHARIEVTDTGIGLTRTQMDALFRPYSQAHDKSQRTDSGSGLGLYVARGIVELHKGEIGVSSPGPGKGSTFWFTLPLAPGS